jgi:hypothetical protein
VTSRARTIVLDVVALRLPMTCWLTIAYALTVGAIGG